MTRRNRMRACRRRNSERQCMQVFTLRHLYVQTMLGLCAFVILLTSDAFAQTTSPANPASKTTTPKTPAAKKPAERAIDVQGLAASVRKSIVVVTFTGRDGKRIGLGSGFVISPDGLIATNLHVIGEARPITVEFPESGKKYPVISIHASERSLDLAIIKIDARDLPALKLGDSDSLKQGQAVVAVGNPYGLKQSVVQGVVSGRRKIDGKPMIQLAIPIEPGNSGGPLLDADGNVQGILTLKSLITQNLGFAVSINALKPLLAKPNPVPMSRWLTIGALDPKDWSSYLGARWIQRAGKILVEGGGSGFGKRSYCLNNHDAPALPYEITVTVRLDDEAGAAGLLFAAEDGGRGKNNGKKRNDAQAVPDPETRRHYGFYPTGGQLRLARFEGRDVRTWHVLATVPSEHYRQGEWNTLKVRVEEGQILCYVNDRLVIKSSDAAFRGSKAGLVKFRQTKAQYKDFRIGKNLPPSQVADNVRERITRLAGEVPSRGPVYKWIDKFLPDGTDSIRVLRDRAKALERQAEQLRQLARHVHHQHVIGQLSKAAHRPDEKVDLFHAALLIARLDNDELDVEAYQKQMKRMADELTLRLAKMKSDADKLAELNKFFFTDYGFHGSRTNYYHRSNSYLNEVMDDREGLPITLSVIYMELARRAGLNIVGVGLPRRFMVKHVPDEGPEQLIDVFDGGKPISRKDAEKIVDMPLNDEQLRKASRRSILVRVVANLLNLAQNDNDDAASLRYLDAMLAVDPKQGNYRGMRAVLLLRAKRFRAALDDCNWLLKHRPKEVDLDHVRQLREFIEKVRS